jgi:hypothetical protein
MTRSLLRLSLVLAALAATAATSAPAAAQEDPARRLSPVGIARTHIGDTYVKVTYGRPYIRDRQIFGAPVDGEEGPLVPFGRLWRTGANEATEITLTGPLMVAGQRLEAGTYSVFTVPGPGTWSVHFSPFLGLDGTGHFDAATQTFTPVYDPASDVLAIQVPARAMTDVVDPFTIQFEATATGADMQLRWDRTEVRIPLALPAGGGAARSM